MNWSRVVMYQDATKWLDSLEERPFILEISPSAQSFWIKYERLGSYWTRSFPGFDVCRDSGSGPPFDLVVLDNVLEHVISPGKALQNVLKMLPSGGRVFVSTPFLIKFHPDPIDVHRWTEIGLYELLLANGFKSIRARSWGNRDCVIANLGDEWIEYKPGKHSLLDDRRFPVMVWAMGVKP